MPLIKSASKRALNKNIETEMTENPSPKDRAQNLAIAYSMQRRNKGAKKKMAQGGGVAEDIVRKGRQSADREMDTSLDYRAGSESDMNEDEEKSAHEAERDHSMHFSEGGFATPEWPGAGREGFRMMEQKLPPDEYSKEGIINYAMGGSVMERDEMPEPTSQRLGSESYLNSMERPISRHGTGMGMREQASSLSQETPSVAYDVRRKYMASGGLLDEQVDDDDLNQNAIEHTNYMYKLNRQLGDHEQFSNSDARMNVEGAEQKASPTEDPGWSEFDDGDGGIENSTNSRDQYDMVNKIRRKYAAYGGRY